MRITHFALVVLLSITAVFELQAQRRSGGTGSFAVFVTDSAGAPLTHVKVTLQGPAKKEATTERGQIAFEDLPLGTYRMRFEADDYVTLERDVVARAGAPIAVKVMLTSAPPRPVAPAPAPPAPESKAAPQVNAKPVAINLSTFIEQNFVGRAPGKTSALACSTGGSGSLIQVRDPLPEHTHADADEFLYVVAGAGAVGIGGRETPLEPSTFMLVPRGTPHTIVARGRTPLVMLSIRAGEPCSPAVAAR
jgi:mannose-6-phosphate isomerase-like protein (cupin superfamily)